MEFKDPEIKTGFPLEKKLAGSQLGASFYFRVLTAWAALTYLLWPSQRQLGPAPTCWNTALGHLGPEKETGPGHSDPLEKKLAGLARHRSNAGLPGKRNWLPARKETGAPARGILVFFSDPLL